MKLSESTSSTGCHACAYLRRIRPLPWVEECKGKQRECIVRDSCSHCRNDVSKAGFLIGIKLAFFKKLLVACSSDEPFSIIIVDPKTGVASWSYKGSELQGAAVGFVDSLGSGGDHLLVSVKNRPLIHAFAVHSRDRYHQKAVTSGVISAFCTNKDGSLLFAAIGAQVFIWLLSSGELLSVVDAHYQVVTNLSLSSDDSTLFTSSRDGSIHCYLVSDMISQCRGYIVEPFRKWKTHTLAVSCFSVSGGANARVASCGLDHVAAIFSVSLDDIILKVSVYEIFSQKNKLVVSADRPLTACQLDSAESRLFLGSDIGKVAQINLYAMETSSELLLQFSEERNERIPIFNGHSDKITTLSINGDGSLLASGDSSGKYCVWEIASKQCLKVSSMRSSISCLKFLPNWPSTIAGDNASVHPVFGLKQTVTGGEKITMLAYCGTNLHKNLWHEEMNIEIAEAIKEFKRFKSCDVRKKRMRKNAQSHRKIQELKKISIKDKIKEIDEIVEVSPVMQKGTGHQQNQEIIERQKQEIQKLKRINAELYNFMASELTGS
ncbi:WD domain, G-beta repeat protein [Dictyocaulus viviparus]|uniref:WD domain, G-beta repeat protein n=1 Tax=Dictyocaulus viviparus TaxID=29172 RepID=A0A0D8XFQ8_DICVI|nr:WD domain, G-beta repeat protein [Dictyocaulus viviparus]